MQRCNIASKPLCSGFTAKLQHLCSCLAVEVMLQRAAKPLCSACSGVHQFAAIWQCHLSLSNDCHFAVMRCTKITHHATKYPWCSGSCKYTIPSEKYMLQRNFATNTFLNGEINCCGIFTQFSFRQHVTVLFHGFLPSLIYDLNHLV